MATEPQQAPIETVLAETEAKGSEPLRDPETCCALFAHFQSAEAISNHLDCHPTACGKWRLRHESNGYTISRIGKGNEVRERKARDAKVEADDDPESFQGLRRMYERQTQELKKCREGTEVVAELLKDSFSARAPVAIPKITVGKGQKQ